MFEVVALVCTLMSPLQCKDIKLSFTTEAVTPFQCMMYGQTELAKWKNEHPGWYVVHGYKCQTPSKYVGI